MESKAGRRGTFWPRSQNSNENRSILENFANTVTESIRGSSSQRTSWSSPSPHISDAPSPNILDSKSQHTPDAPSLRTLDIPSQRTPVTQSDNTNKSPPTAENPHSMSIAPTARHPKVFLGRPSNHYHEFLDIELGGPATLAYRRSDRKDRQVVAIKKFDGTIEVVNMLLRNIHTNIIQCYEAFNLPGRFFLVEEYMDISLREVITCTWDLEEGQIATICLEVGYQNFLYYTIKRLTF